MPATSSQQQQQLNETQLLRSELERMKHSVEKLEREVVSLNVRVQILDSQVAVSQQVNDLRSELDRSQQYSRRSRIVITGLPTHNGETTQQVEQKVREHISHHLKFDNDNEKSFQIAHEILGDIDKAHRVGQHVGNKQAVIAKIQITLEKDNGLHSTEKHGQKVGESETFINKIQG